MLTWNSWTASSENWYGARPEPVRPSACAKNVLLLSAPSTTRELSVPRWPAKLMSPRRTSRVTPGVVRTKSMKFRPFVGRVWMNFSLTTDETSDFVVSTIGASDVTVTSAETFESAMVSFSGASLPTSTFTFAAFASRKPWSCPVTS